MYNLPENSSGLLHELGIFVNFTLKQIFRSKRSFILYNNPLADYVGFMKKVMKLMQVEYPMMAKVELELTQEREMDSLPVRPSKYYYTRIVFKITQSFHVKKTLNRHELRGPAKVLKKAATFKS